MAEQHELEELKRQLHHVADQGNSGADEVLKKVDEYMATDEVSQDHHDGLVQQLRDAVDHFEVEHPRLTAAMQKVVDSLTAAGI
ncbi:MAG: DUF4404 family protein [Acidimicrobiia bacterium]|nr:DUF4404 family protein [Acidimicrobiia bacterium]MDH3470504.1 DUF4404 family protein [Acidimicrobiia bacterium]